MAVPSGMREDAQLALTLACDLRSPGVARQFASRCLAAWDVTACTDVVQLLVSELVTNAVLHAHTQLALVVRRFSDRIRLEVHDASDAAPRLHHATIEETGGRGLDLVTMLATSWGVDRLPEGGKSVWFEIAA